MDPLSDDVGSLAQTGTTAGTSEPENITEDSPLNEPRTDTESQEEAAVKCPEELVTDAQEATEETIIAGEDQVIEEAEQVTVDKAMIEQLSLRVMELFLPNMQKAKSQLNEVLHNQEVLIETVQSENSKFTESEARKRLSAMMVKSRLYHTKLLSLKKEMNALSDKSAKLKKRAVKLQQQKQKEEHQRAVQREKELERERQLMAQVAKEPRPETVQSEPARPAEEH